MKIDELVVSIKKEITTFFNSWKQVLGSNI